jgi:hypothetical protein
MAFPRIDMAGPSQFFSRIFFWTYERGVWQYDLAVILILIFVLLTPARWFNDQPNSASANSSRASRQVMLLSSDDKKQIYQVDSRLLALPERIPALQNELHVALQKSLPELHSGHFSITNIEAVRNEQGIVVAYRVEVHN